MLELVWTLSKYRWVDVRGTFGVGMGKVMGIGYGFGYVREVCLGIGYGMWVCEWFYVGIGMGMRDVSLGIGYGMWVCEWVCESKLGYGGKVGMKDAEVDGWLLPHRFLASWPSLFCLFLFIIRKLMNCECPINSTLSGSSELWLIQKVIEFPIWKAWMQDEPLTGFLWTYMPNVTKYVNIYQY